MQDIPNEPLANESLAKAKQRLLAGMIEFLEPDEEDPDSNLNLDCGYTRADVDRCKSVVDFYLQSVQVIESADQNAIVLAMRTAAIQLNELNATCNGCLIESEQREDLCLLILAAAKNMGLESDDDVTEQWRQW